MMKKLLEVVEKAQKSFRERLLEVEKSPEGLTEEQYSRYLSMQYHLTKGVQKHFLIAASHQSLSHRRNLRSFLVNFANEEELHFEIAAKDLENMGKSVLEAPFPVKLWWAYFNSVVADRPFLRLGATCILENISSGSADVVDRLFSRAKYLNPRCTRFFTIHRHDENLPHGKEILEALQNARLDNDQMNDLVTGAHQGYWLYSKMVDWALLEEKKGDQSINDIFLLSA